MISNAALLNVINSPVRTVRGKVELYSGSTLAATFNYDDRLISFDIERAGENKFFGFGVCQRLNVKLMDIDRELEITTAHSFIVYFNDVNTSPVFYVTEVHRDENTNELSITAYDGIYLATTHTVAELNLPSYTMGEFADACAALLGVGAVVTPIELSGMTLYYPNGANFAGTETIRSALNAVADATQSIYYLDSNNNLVFKRLDMSGAAVLNIDKEKYFTLDNGDNRRLSTICHATELGDNISASLDVTGTTQYIRNNPFWELREDVAALVDEALAAVGGLTINQFTCDWRGNPLLEIGDKISLTTKDDGATISYLLNDTISYDGTLKQTTKWEYIPDNDTETADNPTSIGDAITHTYAKVDKVNRQIDLVASIADANAQEISNLRLTTDSISATVSRVEQNTNESLEGVNDDIETLTNRVDAVITPEDVQIQIESELANGVTTVTTTTGFTFNEEGLTVAKTGSEMSTQITEDGMTVYRDNEAVLTANHDGVDAANLRATTYLIIGTNSRFEDFPVNRTGCFYIGG